ncbi:hypothetical protein MBLNU230_g0401t1 [Neophaeotheca triangularis]
MARPKLTLYLDVISPFAYMAFHITKNSPVFKDCDITYIPIFLGGVMQACGNTPPINIKNKAEYIELQRHRLSTKFRIPIASTSPQPFPQPTLNTQRALCVIQKDLGNDKLIRAFTALYQAFWVEKRKIGEVGVIQAALSGEGVLAGEQEVARVIEKISNPETKAQLNANTDTALKDGCFGLPWFVATNSKGETDRFWGVDQLGLVVEALGLDRGREEGLRALL